MKMKSGIREVEIVNLLVWICEVEIVNLWSRNNELVKLKSEIHKDDIGNSCSWNVSTGLKAFGHITFSYLTYYHKNTLDKKEIPIQENGSTYINVFKYQVTYFVTYLRGSTKDWRKTRPGYYKT
jgi:hypothetical protein